MVYQLYYWPSIQGRGEFVRLALEEAGAEYVDVARHDDATETGVQKLIAVLGSKEIAHPAFAPPILKAGELLIAQTANILMFLGGRHGLAPADEAGRIWLNQLQLTVADWVSEIHDAHHPLGGTLYYEEQKPQAQQRTRLLLEQRNPKFLNYFEQVLRRNPAGSTYLTGDALSYADLSLFQVLSGLQYAFPRAMARLAGAYPLAFALQARVAARPRIAAYLASPRRIAFNQDGIFRHYPQLDP